VVTANARWAISASYDKTLKVWDLVKGKAVRTFKGHTEGVDAVALTADVRWAVSASWDKTLKVWDLATGQTVRTLEGHTRGVDRVAVTPDGHWAVSSATEKGSASDDRTVKVWDLATGEAVRTFNGHKKDVNSVALTSDGRWAISAAYDKTLRVCDVTTGESNPVLPFESSLECFATTADCRAFVVGDEMGAVHFVEWIGGEQNQVPPRERATL